MDNLRASLLRDQLQELDNRCVRWNERYRQLEDALNGIPGISCPPRPEKEFYVGSSIQFSIRSQNSETIQRFLAESAGRGVELKWFGNPEPVGFTSSYKSWEYLDKIDHLPVTNRVLAAMCDMRVPLTFSLEDCAVISDILADVARDVF
jgi:dTDP-4-amino-4,6-dideoxygalactose transaminase